MALLFFILQVIGGLCMIVFGSALIESQDIVTAMLGMMFALIGIMVMIVFVMLIDRELKGNN